jgi:molybdopterin converting factor subunit 1
MIRVLLFASIRDAAGAESVEVDATSVAEVAADLSRRFPAAAGLIGRSRFAVNQQFAGPETRLNGGDEVAVIPPVSGG